MSTGLFHLISNLDSEVAVPDDGFVSRTLYQDDHLKVVLFGFAPGQELSEHTASVPAIMHFVSGNASITIADEESEANAGTWVHMQPKVSHSVYANTATVMLLLLLKCSKYVGASASKGGQ